MAAAMSSYTLAHGQSPLSRFSKAVSMNHFAANKHSYKPNIIKR